MKIQRDGDVEYEDNQEVYCRKAMLRDLRALPAALCAGGRRTVLTSMVRTLSLTASEISAA